MVSFLIDAVLAVMLVTATVFLVIVNKRLKVMRSSQAEIGALIGTFSKTIDETEASVQRLVAAATEASAKLSDGLDRAKGVTEEAALVLGSCERASKRIEASVQEARALVRRLEDGPAPRPRPRPVPPPATVPASVMEPVPAPANAASALDSDAVEDEDGFRPMRVAALAGAAARPAEEPSPVPEAAIETAEATVDTGGARQQAANAFYARLRAIGPER
ncbi:hypothetical protein Sp245p_32540 (plasmid) [Azospirillum baldaniorum]|uniref:DUF6468 domain-containing protein n=1 Tax=Azospirillum baldaniorum TaxID=1064539 RepID=A0A9P1K158_9PROT|nr:DUF6468 domain-containing protein [Azospirillum baldaniorum]AWJ94572.1 hypothetical protein Sp245p_32540 [Azospirillum baldaniorum]TWA70347.1 hypothetical protein FBZ85_12424 [Azospirillum brasilense]CCD03644.1 conserved protein of unknown function [Azospirillum baldaniorum]